jgi:hypothetical protein
VLLILNHSATTGTQGVVLTQPLPADDTVLTSLAAHSGSAGSGQVSTVGTAAAVGARVRDRDRPVAAGMTATSTATGETDKGLALGMAGWRGRAAGLLLDVRNRVFGGGSRGGGGGGGFRLPIRPHSSSHHHHHDDRQLQGLSTADWLTSTTTTATMIDAVDGSSQPVHQQRLIAVRSFVGGPVGLHLPLPTSHAGSRACASSAAPGGPSAASCGLATGSTAAGEHHVLSWHLPVRPHAASLTVLHEVPGTPGSQRVQFESESGHPVRGINSAHLVMQSEGQTAASQDTDGHAHPSTSSPAAAAAAGQQSGGVADCHHAKSPSYDPDDASPAPLWTSALLDEVLARVQILGREQQPQQPQGGEADTGAHTTSTQLPLNVWVFHGKAKWKAGQLERELRR